MSAALISDCDSDRIRGNGAGQDRPRQKQKPRKRGKRGKQRKAPRGAGLVCYPIIGASANMISNANAFICFSLIGRDLAM